MAQSSKKRKPVGKKRPAAKPAGKTWRTGTWIGVLLFVSVWMFILGLLVGRGMVSTPLEFDDSRQALYDLAEKAAQQKEKPAPEQKAIDATPPDPFDGIKQSGRSGSQKDDLFLKPTDGLKPVGRKPLQPAKKQKKPEPPVRMAKPPSKPEPAASLTPAGRKTITSTYHTLQVASLGDLTKAKHLVARLRQKGYKAYVASAAVSGKGVRHRVRIGPYRNQAEAGAALERLKKDGINAILLK